MVREYLNGNLCDEDLLRYCEGEPEAIKPMIDFLKDNPDVDLQQMTTSGPDQYIRKFWSSKRKSYNFLKHADQDANALLDEALINNEDIIFQAMGNSIHLNCSVTPEKELFFSAMYAFGFLKNPPTEPILIWVLMALSREETMHLARKNLCYSRVTFIDDSNIDSVGARERLKKLLEKECNKKKRGKRIRRETGPKNSQPRA